MNSTNNTLNSHYIFSKKAEIGVNNIISQYGSQIHNIYMT